MTSRQPHIPVHSDIPETELLRQVHAGDEQAFKTVYHRLFERMYVYAMRFLPGADAEDVLADSFLLLWQKKGEFATVDGMAAFIHVTIRNRCLNILRNRQTRLAKETELLRQLETGMESNAHQLEQVRVELVHLLYQQVEQLSPRMKEIFLLSFREGLKPADIAERLQLSVQTVSNQKLTAIRLLQAALADHPLLPVLLLLLQLDKSIY